MVLTTDKEGEQTHSREKKPAFPRDRERWLTLPNHLAYYAGEQGVISQGAIWTHRINWGASWIDGGKASKTHQWN